MNQFDEPLSLKFIRKPSRSQEWYDRNIGEQKTRRNSDSNKLSPENNSDDVKPRTNVLGQQIDASRISSPGMRKKSNGDSEGEGKEDLEGFFAYKLVRKKSGEIVKSNLKDSSYFDSKVSKSLPTTPSYKLVHFGDDFDVKYFNKKDKPNAISASNSPTLQSPDFSLDVSDNELDSSFDTDPFNMDETVRDVDDLLGGRDSVKSMHGSTAYPSTRRLHLIDWEIKLINFPNLNYDSFIRRNLPVFVERIFITIDKKFILGHVAVKNLSFEKSVTMRYTFDNWCTVVEIPSIYVPDAPSILKSNNYDRFIFKIQLTKLFNNFSNDQEVQCNNYQFCVKYAANNQEFWDNNEFKNYSFDLTKKITNHKKSDLFDHYHNSVPPKNNSSDSLSSQRQFKPRYSSSYLRRRSSDSKLSSLDSDADYVKNNFYLSSPLLSNYNNNNFKHNNDDELILQPNTSTDTLIPNNNFLNSNELNELDLKSLNSKIFNNPANYNSKSYQDLIDNYCFFNPDTTIEKPSYFDNPSTLSNSGFIKGREPFKTSNPESSNGNSSSESSNTFTTANSGTSSNFDTNSTGANLSGIIYDDSNAPDVSNDLDSPTFTVLSLLGT